MGTLTFQLPANLDAETIRSLERSYLVGGPEYIPWPTDVAVAPGRLTTHTHLTESGCLCAPWLVNGHGRLMLATATLMYREAPYQLLVELARGKVNHLRSQAADWEFGGLQVSEELRSKLQAVGQAFARTVCHQEQHAEAEKLAIEAIIQAVEVGEVLAETYIQQVFQARLEHQRPLDTVLCCRINGEPPNAEQTRLLQETFNAVQIPLSWPAIEPVEAQYRWDLADVAFRWARNHGFAVIGGPILDFADGSMPAWMHQFDGDLRRITNCMEDFLELALQRYGAEVPMWQLTAGSNRPAVLSLSKDDLLRLTNRLFDTAQQMNPNLAFILGISQPWGESLTRREEAYFPFMFVDSLLRNRTRLASLDIEILMGVRDRGSYSRDLLETSRLMDLYALLGLPLRMTLGCPSTLQADSQADPEFALDPRGGPPEWCADVQGSWADRYGRLAACKPYVEAVTWVQFSDQQPHRLPRCGLLNDAGQPNPALDSFRRLKASFLG